ncbi:hypothetical protein M446_0277 [Methylobacterium sp. 4-46]|uniref:hypothetical protein n=1 Tax=unclassified Methylobacterium TaxID=2615210 RepID=UPI000165CA84|nr:MULTISPECIES: hypothetical protein [Methylobacterium]ACA14848.1 hypothetical protein M446_0277 [Methylobacterium sp. 4-46]WFT80591.1 hypothetical protein QA634_01400 [Methylobacterium nodulans]
MTQAKDPGPRGGTRRRARDFGDSAGEGSGGSGLDRHEVGDGVPLTEHPHNPLDDVMTPPLGTAPRERRGPRRP